MGRTPALWIHYHNLVMIIKAYIRAERLHDLDLHLSCVAMILKPFAAAGHFNYGEEDRLYQFILS